MSLTDAVPPAVIEFSTNAARVGWAGSAEPEVVQKPCPGHVRDGLIDNAVAALAWSIRALESHGKSGQSGTTRTPSRAVLCEALWQPRSTREAWSEAAFETHGLDAVGVLKSPVAALFAHARTTGMVLDGGSHAVDILPVQDGYPVMMGARRSTLGGTGLCAYLKKLLAEGDTAEVTASHAASATAYRYVRVYTSKVRCTLRSVAGGVHLLVRLNTVVCYRPTILESATPTGVTAAARNAHAYSSPSVGTLGPVTLRAAEAGEMRAPVIEHFFAGSAVALPQPVDKVLNATAASDRAAGASADAALSPYRQLLTRSYTLPDGNTVQIHSAAARAVDALYDVTPVRELVRGSVDLQRLYVDACVVLDPLSRAAAVNNTLLIGGLSQVPGIGVRLLGELAEMDATASMGGDAYLVPSSAMSRAWGAWLGGSMVASLSKADSLWVSRAEYEEHGARVLTTLCA